MVAGHRLTISIAEIGSLIVVGFRRRNSSLSTFVDLQRPANSFVKSGADRQRRLMTRRRDGK
ncbi:hypothetical protein L484_016013 [Morus notabilis]|uniref:Uncharacterized protein n=1 Tax=Morus notabilis TaxID=981085 RepID=W9RML2_9ROSA|nr:hypothetical protein L484_016013 [Morus notabilis]